jgi:imidazole glycerol-phosphate synthase subunit HisH
VSHSARNELVGIVEYQAGNTQSIQNAFMHLGARTVRVHAAADLTGCSHLVLPGVGAFGFCAEQLHASGLLASLSRWALDERRPLLGICVGMQLLASSSEESAGVPGLGWVGGVVRRIAPAGSIRVPHVGWNTVEIEGELGEFPAGSRADFYFDHSYAYHDAPPGATLGRCLHGTSFSAIVRSGNITAAQFHPEKSQSVGLRFLRAFLRQ